MDNERRTLLLQLTTLGLTAPSLGIFFSGCETASSTDDDDSGADDDDVSDCVPGDAGGPANAHNHEVSIPAAHLEDPIQDRTYTSTGGSHVHTFTVSASQLEQLRDTCSLVVDTSQPHPHSWTITVA